MTTTRELLDSIEQTEMDTSVSSCAMRWRPPAPRPVPDEADQAPAQ